MCFRRHIGLFKEFLTATQKTWLRRTSSTTWVETVILFFVCYVARDFNLWAKDYFSDHDGLHVDGCCDHFSCQTHLVCSNNLCNSQRVFLVWYAVQNNGRINLGKKISVLLRVRILTATALERHSFFWKNSLHISVHKNMSEIDFTIKIKTIRNQARICSLAFRSSETIFSAKIYVFPLCVWELQ